MPVMSDVRAGTQTGDAEYARPYRTPAVAMLSMFGVSMNEAP